MNYKCPYKYNSTFNEVKKYNREINFLLIFIILGLEGVFFRFFYDDDVLSR